MSLLSSIIDVVKRELYYITHDKLYISVVVILPVIMLTFFAAMFYSGSIESLPVALVDRDKSEMSQHLASMIDSTKGVNIRYEPQSIEEAERLMLAGKIATIIYIEHGFESAIYHGISTNVECYVSGASISASGVVERDIQQAVRTFSAGIALNKLQSLGVPHTQALIDIMPINFHTTIVSNPNLNYGYYLAPIFMFMGIVVFTMLATIFAIGRELYYATVRSWIDCASESLVVALIGKLIPITFLMTVMTQLTFFILFVIMGMECMGSYLILTLGSVLFVLAYQSVAIMIISATANLRLALSLGGGYAVMAFTFSGITFPIMSMYGIAQLFAKLFPLTYFSNTFIDQAMRGVSAERDIDELAWLAMFLLLTPLVWRRLRVITSDVKYLSKD